MWRFLPPKTPNDVLVAQWACAALYLLVSLGLSVARRRSRRFDLATVLRAMISGAALPVALLLAAIPFFPDAVKLLSGPTTQQNLMLSGLMLMVLSL